MTFQHRLALLGLIAAAVPAPAGPLFAAEPVPASMNFIVDRDGTPIGTQRLNFHTETGPDGHQLIVDSTIDIKVRAAFVTLYRYEFTGRETWQGGKLVAMDTATDDDGTKFTVHARATPAGLKVDATDAHYMAPTDTIPDSYWPPDTVKRSQFIDIETGKLVDLVSTPAGHRTITVAGRPVDVTLYHLSGVITGELGYGPDGRWLVLRFPSHGSDIAYVPAPH
jgi:hypothetical protein